MDKSAYAFLFVSNKVYGLNILFLPMFPTIAHSQAIFRIANNENNVFPSEAHMTVENIIALAL